MQIPAEIINHILSPLFGAYPQPNPLFGRWRVIIRHNDDKPDQDFLVGSGMWIIFMFRLRRHFGYKTRQDLPNEGQVDNPYPGCSFCSWEYMPYTQGEKDAYRDLNNSIRELVK